METLQLKLASQLVEIGVTGPQAGLPVVYFHSPSTSGEELGGATVDAERLQIRLITLQRSSVACEDPPAFVNAVARCVVSMVDALGLHRPALLGWSGGAPYALASACHLGSLAGAVHLVSPVPGPLTGPASVADQSPRLSEVANTTAASPWVTSAAVLRDYNAVAAPWAFNLASIETPVTIWAPTDDEIVPLRAVEHLTDRLANGHLVEVPGAHDWFIHNWSPILKAISD